MRLRVKDARSHAPLNHSRWLALGSGAACAVACLAMAQPATAQASPVASYEGTFVQRTADYFSADKAVSEPMLRLDDGRQYRLNYGTGKVPSTAPGTRIRINGTRDGNQIVLASGSAQTGSVQTATTVAASGVAKRVAVVLVRFANTRKVPYTPDFARGVAFTNTNSVAAYYAETSGGQMTMSGDVFGWYSIPDTDATCNYTSWAASADKAALAAGVDLSTYDNVVYAIPETSACGWGGLAYVPGRQSFLNGTGMNMGTMAHELGHNFGTHHASALNCKQAGVRVALAANATDCTRDEYGDPYSVMGLARNWHTNVSLANLGWLAPENTQTITTPGDYLLRPVELADPTAVRRLRIPRTAGTDLMLEFRQPGLGSFDAFMPTEPVVNGVSVRIADPDTSITQSRLVDTTPETAWFYDAPLAAGRTLVDPVSGVVLTTLDVSSAGATVRVSYGGPETEAPSAPTGLTVTTARKTASLAWKASTDNVGIAGYRIYRNGSQVAVSAGTSFADTLSGRGTVSYHVVAYDPSGNASPASATVTTG